MSKNLIPEIAKMLGVALGEEFKIKGEDELMTYRFNSDGLQVTYGDGIELSYISTNSAFVALVMGKDEIVKLPWKPKKRERYWTFNIFFESGKWVATSFVWGDEVFDNAVFKVGWVYRTRAEAAAALPKVAAEMGVEYELPTSDTEAVEPWKPKEGEFYYSFGIFAQTWGVSKICWLQHPFDFALLEKGWVYRTREEAQAALPKVAAELGVEYEL